MLFIANLLRVVSETSKRNWKIAQPHPHVALKIHALIVLFTMVKIWKQRKSPTAEEWRKMLCYTYTREYYSAIKKKEFLPFVTAWMDPESMMLSEISQSEKDKYCTSSLICGN